MKKSSDATYSAVRIANRVNESGRQISKASHGRRLDVVVTMDRTFLFAADLIRAINVPVVLHFLREDIHDIRQGNHEWREVFFANRDTVPGGNGRPALKGRDVLLVDAVMDSGVTQEFLLRRLSEGKPRSLRLAVLLDKTSRRCVALEPDYFGFRTASNNVWAGYGLAAGNGVGSNGKHLVVSKSSKNAGAKRSAGGRRKARKK